MVYKTTLYRICWRHKAELDIGQFKQRPCDVRMSKGHKNNEGDGEIGLTMGRESQIQRVRKLNP